MKDYTNLYIKPKPNPNPKGPKPCRLLEVSKWCNLPDITY